MTPVVPARWVVRFLVTWLGLSRFAETDRFRCLASFSAKWVLLTTCETEALETPVCLATSWIVAHFIQPLKIHKER
jgi:hypothetical protein